MSLCRFLFLLLCGLNLNECKKLKMAHVVFRHGARSPLYYYPSDPHQDSAWPDGTGRLTQRGMNMEYELGKFLRKRYIVDKKFVNETYLHKQIHIRSSDIERCIQSAQAQLAAFYPPKGFQIWNKDIDWQPIPIHSMPFLEDVLLRSDEVPCQRLHQKWAEKQQNPEYKKKEVGNTNLFQYLTKHTGMPVNARTNDYVVDPSHCEMAEGKNIPKWLEKVWPQTETMWKWFYTYNFTGDNELGQLLGGTFLGVINNNMETYANNKLGAEELFKMNMFSAHDTTLLALSAALDVFIDMPNYSACIMIELYESKGEHYVEMYYRNNFNDKLIPLKLKRCGLNDCSLNDFIRLTKPRTTEDRSKICGLKSKSILTIYNLEVFVVSLAGFSLLLFVIILYCIVNKSKNSKLYKNVSVPL